METDFLYQNRKKAKVMLLGSHHWKVFGLDRINPDSGNMLSEVRQNELNELLELLEKYQPTKIMIEWPFDKQEQLDKKFESYLSDTIDIDTEEYVWEGYQIGFKLAKRVGHSRVFGIDYKKQGLDNFPFQDVMQFIQENQMELHGSVLQQALGKAEQYLNDVVNKPILENYTIQNSERGLWLNQMIYLILAEIGNDESDPGMDLAAGWYKRNLAIFSKLASHIDYDKEERVFVIFGQGHVPYLIDNLKQSPYFDVIPFNQFVEENKS